MDGKQVCFKCNKSIFGTPPSGMNIGFGAMYWCEDCTPKKTDEEIIQEFYDFMNPPKGGDDGR